MVAVATAGGFTGECDRRPGGAGGGAVTVAVTAAAATVTVISFAGTLCTPVG